MKEHVTILAALHIAHSIIGLLIGMIVLFILSGAGVISCDPDAIAVTSAIAILAASVIFIFSIPGLIGGIGLLKHRPWARILTLVVGCLKLLDIPIGTALGIYTIWVLTQKDTVSLFEKTETRASVSE